ncbi:MAG: hypothetical protein CM15mP83_3170 [Flavobacteriaceae bacterium]|nr:MAG: hypothetical protein CM15mP83_3170 [Flavobacteriaceae bacterium]
MGAGVRAVCTPLLSGKLLKKIENRPNRIDNNGYHSLKKNQKR